MELAAIEEVVRSEEEPLAAEILQVDDADGVASGQMTGALARVEDRGPRVLLQSEEVIVAVQDECRTLGASPGPGTGEQRLEVPRVVNDAQPPPRPVEV